MGPTYPGVTIALTDEGEIIAKGSNVMRGYHRNRRQTAARIDRDGWLHTGDRGKIDKDGYLTITGRTKELFKTETGKYVAPLPIERALARSKLVNTAVVIADGRDYATCILFANSKRIRALVRRESGQDAGELMDSVIARDSIQSLVDSVNKDLSRWEQIRAWRLVENILSVEEGDLTPTLTPRRDTVAAKYGHLIDEMYAQGRHGGKRSPRSSPVPPVENADSPSLNEQQREAGHEH